MQLYSLDRLLDKLGILANICSEYRLVRGEYIGHVDFIVQVQVHRNVRAVCVDERVGFEFFAFGLFGCGLSWWLGQFVCKQAKIQHSYIYIKVVIEHKK
jgi:hypothetical protein